MKSPERMDTHPTSRETSAALETAAAQHGFSLEAVQTLWQSLAAGGGTMAQFSHPEFGGTGQWTQGGMIMIGDMFNHALKARVASLCSALAHLRQEQQAQRENAPVTTLEEISSEQWWRADWGVPAASGSQNNVRYAYFPATQRLAVLQESRLTIYDTGSHRITGIAQQQSSTGTLTFTSQHGSVRLSDLSVVSADSTDAPSPDAKGERIATPEPPSTSSPSQTEREPSEEIFHKIERLAELRDKGILSAEEFLLKKTELLAKL